MPREPIEFQCPRCQAGPELLESTGHSHEGARPRLQIKCCGCGYVWMSSHDKARLLELRRRRRQMTPEEIRGAVSRG